MKKNEDGLHILEYDRSYQGIEPLPAADPVTAAVKMSLECLKRGRPATYPDTPNGLEDFRRVSMKYLEHIEASNETLDRKLIPDVESWAVYAGTTRKSIAAYQKRGGEWTEFIEYFKEILTGSKKQAAFSYAIPPVLAIFDMKNNAGYVDRAEEQVIEITGQPTETAAQIAERVKARHAGATLPEPIDLD